MATKKTDVEMPETELSKFVGFRLDQETQDMLDRLGDNRSAVLRSLVRQAGQHNPPPQERESAL